MNEKRVGSSFVLGLFIAIGLIGLGYFVSSAILKVKSLERVVVVKGLAAQNVKADTAIFPINFGASANDLTILNQKLKSDINTIISFLKEYGFDQKEITISAPRIEDKYTQGYKKSEIVFRYSSYTTITLYSKKVDQVIKLSQEFFKLHEKGVFATNDQYATKYIFTGLNTLKPQMIETATKNAREAALKFAKDSNSKLGKIKKANQGYFSISNRDSSTPYIKTIRVVTNVSYYLND